MIVDRSIEVLARRIPAENYLGGLSCTVYSHPLKHISMRNPYLRAKTLDDLLRYALQSIEKYGEPVRASKGRTSEVRGVVLELTNPRARLSRTESRGKIFSCIGELCWYLKGTNRTAFVAHYIPAYRKSSEQGLVYGGYGPRLFKSWKGVQQFENLIYLLKRRPTSRQAVLQLFDSTDLAEPHEDVPCTCTLQFLIRGGKLHLVVYMRSNDVVKGLPHDIFCFTMLQEMVARIMSVELGIYKHCVGSLHLYDTDKSKAESFMREGWQSTKSAMPPMPDGDPRPAIALLLKAEATVRRKNYNDSESRRGSAINPYWADLIRLLKIFNYGRRRNKGPLIRRVRTEMASPIYDTYIRRILDNTANA
jgi:thymidylate synthase